MAVRVAAGLPGLTAHRYLALSSARTDRSLERLTSGLRINRAADDAAGLAISEGLRARLGGGAQALRNTWDAVSLVQVADGALHETTAVLQRMRDLAVQAANRGVVDADAGSAIQRELDDLKAELTRIASVTSFAGRPLLDGSYAGSFQVGAGPGDVLDVRISAATGATGLGVDGVNVFATADPASVHVTPATGSVEQPRLGQVVLVGVTAGGDLGAVSGTISYGGSSLDLGAVVYADTDADGTVSTAEQVAQLNAAAAAAGITHRPDPFVDDGDDLIFRGADPAPDATDAELATLSPGYGGPHADVLVEPARTTIPPRAGLITFPGTTAEQLPTLRGRVTVGGASLELGSVDYTDTDQDGVVSGAEALAQLNAAAAAAGLSAGGAAFAQGPLRTLAADEHVDHGSVLHFRGPVPADGATPEEVDYAGPLFRQGQDMISTIDLALETVMSQRAQLGALQNRLEHTVAARGVADENTAAALSRIRDADLAAEMAALTRSDVLRQAGLAMLAQAGDAGRNVLRLLQA
ncbi:flagellin N-terminal helical domain-containing protein [Blastococcus sp. SYSU D01042]